MSAKSATAEKSAPAKEPPTRSQSHSAHSFESSSNLFGLSAAQQSAGNLAIQRLFQAGVIQAKLPVSQPGDPQEQEADRLANGIMSCSAVPTIQRKYGACASGTPSANSEEETVQRKSEPGSAQKPFGGFDRVASALRGSGEPLPHSLRAELEPRFGRDFRDVRVHTDSDAAAAAEAVNALAFTTGNDIVFAPGRYLPEKAAGRTLLAHELVHVVQQRTSGCPMLARQPAPVIAPPLEAPMRPPLRSIPGEGTGPGEGTEPEPIPGSEAPRYAPAPGDYTLEHILARASAEAKRHRDIAEVERPSATLERGGRSPDFITVEREELGMWQWGNARFRVRKFHVLDAIEYEVGRATNDADLERVLVDYMGFFPFRPGEMLRLVPLPLTLPPNVPIFPPNFDPGGVIRMETYVRAVARRVSQVPDLARSPLAAVGQASEENRRRRPIHYPILWPSILPLPLQFDFMRHMDPDRDEELAEILRAGKWIRAKREELRGQEFVPHHVIPLFLGGADLPSNVILWNAEVHRRGHEWLRWQPQMLIPPPPLPPLPQDLLAPEHTEGTPYRMIGVKTSRDDVTP